MSTISLVFSRYFFDLLTVSPDQGVILYPLVRRASIKDIIEALGVPHPEVGSLLANGAEIDFSYIPEDNDRIKVSPLTSPVDVVTPSILRPQPFPATTFAVDVNVAKLAPLLRMI
ncbi:MAG: hypothetical protein OEL66_09800, partial [Desulfobulbaceae bacterium]|nr:hypothetical protein [Desulfobulbaceae bacterium]